MVDESKFEGIYLDQCVEVEIKIKLQFIESIQEGQQDSGYISTEVSESKMSTSYTKLKEGLAVKGPILYENNIWKSVSNTREEILVSSKCHRRINRVQLEDHEFSQ